MKVLLDTCSIIWAISDPGKLTSSAREILLKKESAVYISPISAAEIACLSERKRILLDRHWKLWFNHFVSLNKWKCVDITIEIIQEAYSLPGEFHQDPADRIIVATARKNDLAVITGDRKIIGYPHVRTIW